MGREAQAELTKEQEPIAAEMEGLEKSIRLAAEQTGVSAMVLAAAGGVGSSGDSQGDTDHAVPAFSGWTC
jgi:hypothetical protein